MSTSPSPTRPLRLARRAEPRRDQDQRLARAYALLSPQPRRTPRGPTDARPAAPVPPATLASGEVA